MTDIEACEWGDLVSIKYNSAISGAREQLTGVVLGVEYDNPPRLSDGEDKSARSVIFHPMHNPTLKAPIYQAHFGDSFTSLVEKSEKRLYPGDAAGWFEGDTVDEPLLKWAAVSSPEKPGLTVSVFPCWRNRVYSDP
jgi:hypothetical protein